MKNKIRTWKIEIEFIDKGNPNLSNLITGKKDKYYYLKRDIKEDLEYFFRKINDVSFYKIKTIKKLKKIKCKQDI